ncbi:helix-turn-helix domain-containing protein [Lacticaseibacillus mingshuiensis]|uniref:helix-turn-helix domain-containing protein n=1 Tax=Lacticaseibacillus mingshuiensis TaxID=2799574 RepID=UPI0019518C70|nr:helix-turn-helix transcriptional regulator [Lacticaseibacillus mingshuiensis]
MLQFNLKKIMDEKNISISSLSNITGVSRKTISQMVNNDSKGVQFATIEPIMSALNAEIEEVIIKAKATSIVAFFPAEDFEDFTIEEKYISNDENNLSLLVGAQLITWLGGIDDIDNDGNDGSKNAYFAVLGVQMSKTGGGNLIGNVYPALSSDSKDTVRKTIVQHSNKMMDFVKNCSGDEIDRLTANIVALSLENFKRRHKNLNGINTKSSALMTWSQDQPNNTRLGIAEGNDFMPFEKHLNLKLEPSLRLNIVNAPLNEFLKTK